MAKSITVTGATGNIGSLVVATLLEKGTQVKALVRDPSKAEELRKSGVEIVEGEFTDAEAVRKAMEGADSALLIAPPNPDAVKQMSALIAAAKNSGNPHVVRISAIGAAVDAPTDNGRLHYQSDTELADSGLPHTILRPHQAPLLHAESADVRPHHLGAGPNVLGYGRWKTWVDRCPGCRRCRR